MKWYKYIHYILFSVNKRLTRDTMLIRSAVFLAICRISKPTEIQNILGGILLFKYLKKINFREINFTGISFCGCKFWHIYLEFIFADGEILIISRGFSFVIARYLIFTSSKTITAWKVSVFGVILVRIFPHSDWIGRDTSISPYLVRMRGIRTRITPNTDTFYGSE